MPFQLHNPRFGKDVQNFKISIPPTTSPEGLPFGPGVDDPPCTTHFSITLEPDEIGIGRVFRGIMKSDESAAVKRVIVKLVAPLTRMIMRDGQPHAVYHKQQRNAACAEDMLADLAHEALQYAQFLPGLQGTVVPRFYGHGISEDGNAGITVLEDVGSSLKFPYQRLPAEDRLVLLQHEFDLHRAGVLHGDVAYRNFVKGPKGIRLIDFDRARAHSACPYYKTERQALTLENANTPLECAELDKARIWFGFCERWDLSSKQWARFVPWDGPLWGSDAPQSLEEDPDEAYSQPTPS